MRKPLSSVVCMIWSCVVVIVHLFCDSTRLVFQRSDSSLQTVQIPNEAQNQVPELSRIAFKCASNCVDLDGFRVFLPITVCLIILNDLNHGFRCQCADREQSFAALNRTNFSARIMLEMLNFVLTEREMNNAAARMV